MDKRIEEWIIEADIASMQAAMEAGNLSSEELVKVYLERIHLYDSRLNTILELNPEAIEIAKALDSERKAKGSRGRLHGIPILLKDNIDTRDQMHTSAGSIALADSYAAEDSFVASQLRKAGAVILGKTNMTEWANFMSSTMWSGYSSRGGQVLNPYGPGELFIGGSSSGSAAAVAANFAAAAIGTETSGSIVGPANQNSVVGIKPTVGLISRSGIIPISQRQDTPGPFARTVADAALLLGALTGIDERDSATLSSANRAFQDYTPFLAAGYLKQARIGIPRFYYKHLDKDRLAIVEAAISIMKSEGVTIIDPITLPCEQTEWDHNFMRYEFKRDLNKYLSKLPEAVPVHSLHDVIEFNERHAEIALKYGQGTLTWAEEMSCTPSEISDLEEKIKNSVLSHKQGINDVFEQNNLDAIMFLGEDGSDVAARAGYPLITVPGGFAANGIIAPGGYITKGPHGITFMGTAYSEPLLIKIAYGFEQATHHRIPPQL